MTRGVIPYSDVSNAKLREYLDSGNRLPQPLQCPDEAYHLMLSCFLENPKERPDFPTMVHMIRTLMSQHSPDPYTRMLHPVSEQFFTPVFPGKVYTNFYGTQFRTLERWRIFMELNFEPSNVDEFSWNSILSLGTLKNFLRNLIPNFWTLTNFFSFFV